MVVEIIPTVFALNEEEFQRKLNLVSFAEKIHLDFMDKQFVKNKSLNFFEMKAIKVFKCEFGVHLMAVKPHKYIKEIKTLGIRKVLIHYKAYKTELELLQGKAMFQTQGIKTFLVLNPDIDVERVVHLISSFDGIMLMSVWPGEEKQAFIEEVLEKIKKIRKLHPKLDIQVDGGIKDTNAAKIVESGANLLSVGSFISSSKKPKTNYEKLVSLVNN